MRWDNRQGRAARAPDRRAAAPAAQHSAFVVSPDGLAAWVLDESVVQRAARAAKEEAAVAGLGKGNNIYNNVKCVPDRPGAVGRALARDGGTSQLPANPPRPPPAPPGAGLPAAAAIPAAIAGGARGRRRH